jgi:GT2 family glycosyltransferase
VSRPTVAVVVCAYTLARWDDLKASIASAVRQSQAPEEVWLVIDHNPDLQARCERELGPLHPSLRVVANSRKQGLSGARNTALECAQAEVIVFLDDDAAAEAEWLARLVAPYEDGSVIGVGGSATPRWDWVVGCTYAGQPTQQAPVRNMMGCNMSFRRQVFESVGGFSENLGRVGKVPLGCEETELCIRAQAAENGSRILFEPAASVRHHVSSDRLTWRYLLRRCYAEGVSKAAVARMVARSEALATERGYATTVLPRGVLRELGCAVRGPDRSSALGGALAIVLGLVTTVLGYLRGQLSIGPNLGQSTPGLALPSHRGEDRSE